MNLSGRINDVERVQAAVFSDSRCPQDVRKMGRMAIKHHLMVIVSLALIQNETELAHKYVRELVGLDWTVLDGAPCELVEFLLSECVADENVDHEELLKQVFTQLPQELNLSSQYEWAVSQGYLWKGIRAVIWGRLEDGQAHFARAMEMNAKPGETLLQLTTYHLLGYEKEFGVNEVMQVISRLASCINQVARRSGSELEGSYLINRAFENFHAGEYKKVPGNIIRAWISDPGYLTNRGVVSIFLRSVLKGSK